MSILSGIDCSLTITNDRQTSLRDEIYPDVPNHLKSLQSFSWDEYLHVAFTMNQLSSMQGTLATRLLRQATFNVRGSLSLEDEDLGSVYSSHSRLTLHLEHSVTHQDVTINVSGTIFETCMCVLERHPETILGDPEKRKQLWDEKKKQFFVDAHPPSFEAIFQFLQSGKIKRPYEVPLETFIEQLENFELDPEIISVYKFNEGILQEEKVVLPEGSDLKRTLWKTFEVPSSSIAARVCAYVCHSNYIVIVSTVHRNTSSISKL